MKKILFISLAVILALSVGIMGCTTPAQQEEEEEEEEQQEVDLTYAYDGPPVGALPESLQWFCDEVGLRTDGKVNIEMISGLLAMDDALAGIGQGVADCGLAIVRDPSQSPNWATLALLGAADDLWVLVKASGDMCRYNDDIRDELATLHNVVPLHGYTPGTPMWTLKEPVATLGDLEGLRMALGHPDEAAIAGDMGVEAVYIELFDMYDALDKGTIDGTAAGLAWVANLQLYDVAKYSLMFTKNLLAGACTTVFNKDVWDDSLTSETHDIIMEVASEWDDKFAQAIIEQEAAGRETMTAAGFQFTDAPTEIDSTYQTLIQGVQEDFFNTWDAQGYNTREVWEAFQEYVDQYEEELAEEGYPWE